MDKDLFAGLIRLHILLHAAKAPVYGAWIIEELRHHQYDISPGTLYPMLHGLAAKGYLSVSAEGTGKRARRLYTLTPEGAQALGEARAKVRELWRELFEDDEDAARGGERE
ncbi:PadR family transcriptional regulator [Pararhodospirillum photometricum]|uniref:Transcriptional Regulator, PadR-like family protein n=1 Tax=Pararhodospirillum photometricum DSM 122 TaxID=1150469 RepID=H6SK57_PARPM|nr:PadR family transcriptional regulator [Pararhodospirillum photometricum]CCG08372.1 Transcriptional Regulator, PadR-like family protein [Pararhodospirillum photometricum DSM 122]